MDGEEFVVLVQKADDVGEEVFGLILVSSVSIYEEDPGMLTLSNLLVGLSPLKWY